jgi:pimeloyl-ACP methyl ester carboxylesterase
MTMRNKRSFLFLVSFLIISMMSFSQTKKETPVYVMVHGAWGGGWAFKEVDSLLTAKGCSVYRPTLTGHGERAHLASPEIRLETHILDVVNTILYEDLHNIILVGHSYGGMVITGVADTIPERIKKLIYLDAFIPENGESLNTIDEKIGRPVRHAVDGFIIPYWVPEGTPPPKDVPQSFKTFNDPIKLDNPLRIQLTATFILTVDRGKRPEDDDFAWAAQRAEKKKWPIFYLEADHNAQWSAPKELAGLLWSVGNEQ